jgi:acetyl-CoA carboxylase, biotin carboxylase subunit
MSIRRILIANRGEIATRIIRTCRALDIEAVLAVSSADRDGEPARQADRVVCIGPARSADSYLNAAAIVHAAVATGADAGFVDRLYARRPDLRDQDEAGASHG